MGQKINIAIIAGQLVVGGAEWQLYLWLANLDRERFEPVVLTLHPGHGDYWEKPIENLGITLYRIPHRFSRILRLLNIIKILRAFKPKLIHGWHLFASPYAGFAGKFLGVKSLGGNRRTLETFLDNALAAKLTLSSVNGILSNSLTAANGIQQLVKRENQKIFMVQNAIEASNSDRLIMREKISQLYGISLMKLWIGSLGRLESLKRFDYLLQAIFQLKKVFKDFHFLLIGDGPERKELEKLVDELGISECVSFTGEIPNAKELLGALDIFCFTSTNEGLANVIMEAAAAGLPIVTWRLPFNEELLEDGKTALLVEAEDINGFKEAIVKLIQSPAHRATLGEAARKHILVNFGLERYVKNMTHVYETLLGIQENVNGDQT